MSVTGIILAAVIVGGTGLFIGVFLGVAGKKFAVEVDEREEAILGVLPGNNCGGCGYAGCSGLAAAIVKGEAEKPSSTTGQVSNLQNWPVQIKLAPVSAPYFNGAKLLIAADCTAYAYAGFHQDFIRNKVTLIGCPKLDQVDYSEKLTAIIQNNDIQSVTIVRMEVPCCGGLEMATRKALQNSGKFIPWQVITIGIDGNIIE